MVNTFASFVELHILHHAQEQPVYGLWLIEELGEHGYKISPGTLYPILHSMEAAALLRIRAVISNGKTRKYYSITARGKKHLRKAKRQLSELVNEVFDADDFRLLKLPSPSKRR
jgi:PadR family transcriptional regulator, regulatory protein PadR